MAAHDHATSIFFLPRSPYMEEVSSLWGDQQRDLLRTGLNPLKFAFVVSSGKFLWDTWRIKHGLRLIFIINLFLASRLLSWFPSISK